MCFVSLASLIPFLKFYNLLISRWNPMHYLRLLWLSFWSLWDLIAFIFIFWLFCFVQAKIIFISLRFILRSIKQSLIRSEWFRFKLDHAWNEGMFSALRWFIITNIRYFRHLIKDFFEIAYCLFEIKLFYYFRGFSKGSTCRFKTILRLFSKVVFSQHYIYIRCSLWRWNILHTYQHRCGFLLNNLLFLFCKCKALFRNWIQSILICLQLKL